MHINYEFKKISVVLDLEEKGPNTTIYTMYDE